ncbi:MULTISPECIES: helix-turn-helix domain-containing protein [unclassified Streptomyces]|uniref:helix-turn-helix domain-containing protein n=1 Tax=unclassified Streptomyces TaxID=2593676 RepID=UPI00117C364D|nr:MULTISPECIES: helix-turn-helix transcriptional regulator [unclassified Streptomyces]
MPELAELGTMLRDLFNTLGISQRQYAKRISVHPSVVSRAFGGQRMPTKHFIEQLISEVESERGGFVTPEARDAIRVKWLMALKETDPAEFQLESLRGELARSRRDTERANRNVEALHLLLQQREAQVHDAAADLAQLRLDWSAERAEAAGGRIELRREQETLSASREALLREIEQLKKDLREAERLRSEAEAHSGELRERVLLLEAELAERGAVGGIPLEVFKSQLLRMWEEENFPEASRDLTEAAWSRPLDEVLDLMAWLSGRRDREQVSALVSDAGRLRPAGEVLRVAAELVTGSGGRHGAVLSDTAVQDAWVAAVASRITESNVADYYRRVLALEGPGGTLSDRMLAAAVRRATTPSEALGLLTGAMTGGESANLPLTTSAVVAPHRVAVDAGFPFHVAVGLLDAGMRETARLVIARVSRQGSPKVKPSAPVAERFDLGLRELAEPALHSLFAFLAECADERLAGAVAVMMYHGAGGDLSLFDRLLDELRPRTDNVLASMMDRWSPDLFEYVVNYWWPGGAGAEPAPGRDASPPTSP